MKTFLVLAALAMSVAAPASAGRAHNACPSMYFTIPTQTHSFSTEQCPGNIFPHVFVGGSPHQLWIWQTTNHRTVETLYGREVAIRITQKRGVVSVTGVSLRALPVKVRIRFGIGVG